MRNEIFNPRAVWINRDNVDDQVAITNEAVAFRRDFEVNSK